MHQNGTRSIPSGAMRIEALVYRSLRFVEQPLGAFHVLVGPNASGKSTFLDVPAFLGDMVRGGLESAVHGDARLDIPLRAVDAQQLTWMRQGSSFELALELQVPERLQATDAVRCRYEVRVEVRDTLRIGVETLWLKPDDDAPARHRTLFPGAAEPPPTILMTRRTHAPTGWKKVVSRAEDPERVTFEAETSDWGHPFKLATDQAALASLPQDEERFPVATWFRRMLSSGVRSLALSGEHMRKPSPPGKARSYLPDGSNLAHIVQALESESPVRFAAWVAHVREALPDLVSITTRERDEDRHRYLVLQYASGLEVPSWLTSDGTLRVLALTILAYLPDLTGIYLIEEPENGIHPRALESVFQSLSSVYGAHVLLATHSPIVAGMAALDQILCFSRTPDGATDLVSGVEHPRLRAWRGTLDLGTLLAAGVLG